MTICLSKEIMEAFYLAETAIKKVLSGSSFTWEEFTITTQDHLPQHPAIAEEKHFVFSGYIVGAETLFSITSSVRKVTDDNGNCEFVNVDVLCDFPNAQKMSAKGEHRTQSATKEISCFTVFLVEGSGDLKEIVHKS